MDLLAYPSPQSSSGYPRSVGDTHPVPPRDGLHQVEAVLCSDLTVWHSFLCLQRGYCSSFQLLGALILSLIFGHIIFECQSKYNQGVNLVGKAGEQNMYPEQQHL